MWDVRSRPAVSNTDPIVPPLVVAEGGDVTVFRSATGLISYIEPWFPNSADYRAFDSEGRRLELVADPPIVRRRLVGPVWTDNAHKSSLLVRSREAVPSGADELAGILRELLAFLEVRLDESEGTRLDELLTMVIERLGFVA